MEGDIKRNYYKMVQKYAINTALAVVMATARKDCLKETLTRIEIHCPARREDIVAGYTVKFL